MELSLCCSVKQNCCWTVFFYFFFLFVFHLLCRPIRMLNILGFFPKSFLLIHHDTVIDTLFEEINDFATTFLEIPYEKKMKNKLKMVVPTRSVRYHQRLRHSNRNGQMCTFKASIITGTFADYTTNTKPDDNRWNAFQAVFSCRRKVITKKPSARAHTTHCALWYVYWFADCGVFFLFSLFFSFIFHSSVHRFAAAVVAKLQHCTRHTQFSYGIHRMQTFSLQSPIQYNLLNLLDLSISVHNSFFFSLSSLMSLGLCPLCRWFDCKLTRLLCWGIFFGHFQKNPPA